MTRAADNTKTFFDAGKSEIEAKGSDGIQGTPTKITNDFTVNVGNKVYTLASLTVDKPYFVDASFTDKLDVELKITNGQAYDRPPDDYTDQDPSTGHKTVTWGTPVEGENGLKTYTTQVDIGAKIYLVVKPTDGYVIKSVVINGLPVSLAEALASGIITRTDTGYLVYKSPAITRTWRAEAEFAQQSSVTFTHDGH